jgi:hypothetical protein
MIEVGDLAEWVTALAAIAALAFGIFQVMVPEAD